jgi:hypothetical protein
MVSRVELKNLMQSFQGSYRRDVVGSMRTTPIEVLEVALCQTPLDLAVICATALTAYVLVSGRMEECRARTHKARFPSEIPFHIETG